MEFDLTDPDVLEARSNVHAGCVRVLALSSGKFAIFSRGTQLHAIVETLREEVIREYCAEEMKDWTASVEAEAERRGMPHPILRNPEAKSAGDLGL